MHRVLEEVGFLCRAEVTAYQYLYSGNFTNISPLSPSASFQSRILEQMEDIYRQFAVNPAHGLEEAGRKPAREELDKSRMFEWGADGQAEESHWMLSISDMGASRMASLCRSRRARATMDIQLSI